MADLFVSGKPPLLLIITAEPLLAASKLVLPNGSSHLELTTDILTVSRVLRTYSCEAKPTILKFLCLKVIFSLGSSPITIDFQSLYLFSILIIASPNKSYPLALFSLPINEINFFFFEKLIFF